MTKFKRKIKKLCKRNWSVNLDYRIMKLNQVTRGWINYFAIADMKSAMREIDSHLMTQMRIIIWKQWKVPAKREWGLRKLGIKKWQAHLVSYIKGCPTYTKDRTKCARNYISGKNIEQILLLAIRRISRKVITDEVAFAEYLKELYKVKVGEAPKRNKADLAKAKKRYDELDVLIRGIYENYVSGKLPERQYISLIGCTAEN